MSKRICAQCGGEVVGKSCLRPNCLNYWQNFWEQKVRENLPDYQYRINIFLTQESSLELEDYKEVKKIAREVKEWESKLENSSVQPELEQFLKDIEELEKKFPERIRLKHQNQGKSCRHENIYWDGFFKTLEEKKQKPYCLDCGEDGNKSFVREFQRWYCEKIVVLLVEQGLEEVRFRLFLEKQSYEGKWVKAKMGGLIETMEYDPSGLWYMILFREFSKNIEELFLEFKKEKELERSNNNKNKDRERERERRKLQRKIKKLEKKPNKTLEEEEELDNLKNKFKDLDSNSSTNSFNYVPWIIGGVCLLTLLVIIVFIFVKKKKVEYE